MLNKSAVVLKVKIDKIAKAPPFVSNFQIERSIKCQILDTLIINREYQLNMNNGDSIEILYKTSADNRFVINSNLAIKEKREYIVFLSPDMYSKQRNTYLLVNNYIGIILFDPLCSADIIRAYKNLEPCKLWHNL